MRHVWTHRHKTVHVSLCVHVGEITSVSADPCQSWRSAEFVWRDAVPMYVLPSPVSGHEGGGRSDDWTVLSNE